jgi:DNA repair exonuclease SbcCD nuclease subunit
MNYNKKYLLGDIHGEWSVIARHIVGVGDIDVAYIQVGDFGVGFDHIDNEVERLKKLNDILNEYKCDLYVVRGNHDDPIWFKDENLKEYKSQLNRIIFVPDYTMINIDDENILFVGGAISIDRVPRRMSLRESWWEDEVFVLDKNKLNLFEGVDRVITHTSPNFCSPVGFNNVVYLYARNDKGLLDELIVERNKITEMASILMMNGRNPNLKGWYYGHFHSGFRTMHSNIEFICLDINQFMRL